MLGLYAGLVYRTCILGLYAELVGLARTAAVVAATIAVAGRSLYHLQHAGERETESGSSSSSISVEIRHHEIRRDVEWNE